jgi:hypothetical protein
MKQQKNKCISIAIKNYKSYTNFEKNMRNQGFFDETIPTKNLLAYETSSGAYSFRIGYFLIT